MNKLPLNKPPLEDPALDRQYALESELWNMMELCQRMFMDIGILGSIHETTENALRAKVTYWREHMPLYLQHPKWEETKGADDGNREAQQ